MDLAPRNRSAVGGLHSVTLRPRSTCYGNSSKSAPATRPSRFGRASTRSHIQLRHAYPRVTSSTACARIRTSIGASADSRRSPTPSGTWMMSSPGVWPRTSNFLVPSGPGWGSRSNENGVDGNHTRRPAGTLLVVRRLHARGPPSASDRRGVCPGGQRVYRDRRSFERRPVHRMPTSSVWHASGRAIHKMQELLEPEKPPRVAVIVQYGGVEGVPTMAGAAPSRLLKSGAS